MIIANVHDYLWFLAASRGGEVATRRERTAGWEILAAQQTTKRPTGFIDVPLPGLQFLIVPVLDMLHAENDPNGTYNVTEFGTVRDPDLFAAMLAYSPYHHVVDGTAYPAVLLTAGEFDPRVHAYHAKKMTARLQAATSSDAPVLLRMEAGGHGIGQSLEQQIGLESDVLAFVSAQLGLV
jgi:prolyl oligopeptidase PreP (S9A serine peptidase family)